MLTKPDKNTPLFLKVRGVVSWKMIKTPFNLIGTIAYKARSSQEIR